MQEGRALGGHRPGQLQKLRSRQTPHKPASTRPPLQRWQQLRSSSLLPAAAGGDGGSSSGSSGGGGSSNGRGGSWGGGGGGGGGEGDSGDAPKRTPGLKWRGWEERVAADPQFGFKVFCELVIGLTATVLGDMSSRPNWGLNELDFVFATLVVGAIINFSAVWLLAPTAGAGGVASAGLLQKALGDHFLLAWGAPGGHMFERGFPLSKRLLNLAYKGLVFGAIGMGAGVVGTAVSNGLITLRKKMDPNWSTPNVPPDVLANAGCWAAHMGVSANTRYQFINGLDMVLQPLLPSSAFRVYSFLLRSANNVLGGISFVTAARILGVQKTAEPAAETAAAAAKPTTKKAKAQ